MAEFDLKVRVIPGAARGGISGWHGGALKVKTTAPAEDGRANRAVCALMAEAAGLGKRAVTVLRGATAREKVLRVRGVDRETFLMRVGSGNGDGVKKTGKR